MSEQFWVAACNAAVNSDVQLLCSKTRAWGAVVVSITVQLIYSVVMMSLTFL